MALSAPASEVIPFGRRTSPLGATSLGAQERAVLAVLLATSGRVVSRRELSRLAGLADLSERRCDGLLVGLRRALGETSIRTVRSRGWMLVAESRPAAEALLAG
jgi:DNA-binding response OmpR family regulator